MSYNALQSRKDKAFCNLQPADQLLPMLMEPLLKEPLLDFFSRLNVKERFANESLNKCVVCYWKAGEKIEASLSLSALEVVCKTTLQHSEQWKAQQQMTTCGTKHGGGQHVL